MVPDILLRMAYIFIYTVLNFIVTFFYYDFGWRFNIRIFPVSKRILLNRFQMIFYHFKVPHDDNGMYPAVYCLWYERFSFIYFLAAETICIVCTALDFDLIYVCRASAIACLVMIIVWLILMKFVDKMIKKRVKEFDENEIAQMKELQEAVDYIGSKELFLQGLFIKKEPERKVDTDFEVLPIKDDDLKTSEETFDMESGKQYFDEVIRKQAEEEKKREEEEEKEREKRRKMISSSLSVQSWQ